MTRSFQDQVLPENNDGYLDGKLLIAMPLMQDTRFAKSVIYVCAHSEKGAMGLIINQIHDKLTFSELLMRLDVLKSEERKETTETVQSTNDIPIHVGGPVETGRGFVLHTSDYFIHDTTLPIDTDICLTATIDILKSMARGKGPNRTLMALGYSGWDAGQLDSEIQANGWLWCDADPDLVFFPDTDQKYDMAMDTLGISADQLLHGEGGHA